jgi:hypothetical protein
MPSNTDADFFYLSSTVYLKTVTVMVIFGENCTGLRSKNRV